MTNPFINAALAAIYISALVSGIHALSSISKGPDDPFVAPIVFLGTFVLSAAIMGLLFVYQPLRLYLDGKKDEALPFFLKTLGTFACFVAIVLAILITTPLIV